MSIESAPKMLGRYQILALLATGGMAEIFLAKQTGIKGFERLVAVKKIHSHLARQPHFVEMFFDEARIAAQLNHPNIVQIFDIGQEDEDYYIAMEYLEGESLGYLVKKALEMGYVLPPELSAGIVAQICNALDYAHNFRDENGDPMHIVHRDVSPHNIIVLYSGGVKLVDFGIAKAASQIHHTVVGTMKGKLTYMSPEQYYGKPVDSRADVFALGVILWELLTHRRLFKRDNEAATTQAVLSEAIPRVRELNPKAPADFDELVHQALQRDPAARLESAAEMGKRIWESLRACGTMIGTNEIAAFVNTILGERVQTKRVLLDDLYRRGDQKPDTSLSALKPGTSHSLPTGSSPPAKPALVFPAEGIPLPSPAEKEAVELSSEDLQILETEDDRHAVRPEAVEDLPDRTTDEIPVEWEKSDSAENLAPPDSGEQPDEIIGQDVFDSAPRDTQASLSMMTQPVELPASHSWIWMLVSAASVAIIALGFWWWQTHSSLPTPEPHQGPPLETPALAGDPSPEPPKPPPENRIEEKPDPPDSSKPTGAAPQSAPKPLPALLTLVSQPAGCRVELDGTELPGATPLELVEVEGNKSHRVTVSCPAAQAETQKFSAKPAEQVTLRFSPEPLAQKCTSPKCQPPRPRPVMGTLRLDTVPWSDVYEGKRKLGMTPLLDLKLSAGVHRLKAVNKGRSLSKSLKAVIKPGETTTLKINLEE